MALDDIRARIRAAEAAAGRPPGSVTLIAVSKLQPPDRVEAVLSAGARVFGENYVQEAQGEWVAQDIPLNIVYEDEHILVIDSRPGWSCTRLPGTPAAPCSMRCCTMCRISSTCRAPVSSIASTRTRPA